MPRTAEAARPAGLWGPPRPLQVAPDGPPRRSGPRDSWGLPRPLQGPCPALLPAGAWAKGRRAAHGAAATNPSACSGPGLHGGLQWIWGGLSPANGHVDLVRHLDSVPRLEYGAELVANRHVLLGAAGLVLRRKRVLDGGSAGHDVRYLGELELEVVLRRALLGVEAGIGVCGSVYTAWLARRGPTATSCAHRAYHEAARMSP